MKYSYFCFLQIFFPIIAGGLLLIRRAFRSQKNRDIFVFCSLFLSTALTVLSVFFLKGEVSLFYMTDTLMIVLRADALQKLFSILTAGIWLVVGVYSFRYLKGTGKTVFFYSSYLCALGVLQGLSLAGNLVTFYLFYEWMTLTTLPLVLQLQTKEAVRAARKYLFYSVAGASLSLVGIFLLSGCTAGLSFQAGGLLATADQNTVLIATMFLIFGFGTKAGLFPLHGWLPVAHPAAPAPASAVLSGVITKAGALGIIRVVFQVVSVDVLRGTYVQYVFLGVTLLTVFMGSMLAYKEQILKKRLAYSTISQVSYLLFGVALMTPEGLAAAFLHMLFHAVMKSALFLFSGTFLHETKEERVEAARGFGKKYPFTLLCFTGAALSMIGIPPFSGFYSKWYLAVSAMNAPVTFFSYVGPAVLLISALLTAGYLLPISMKGFYPGKDFVRIKNSDEKKQKSSFLLFFPVCFFALTSLALGFFAAPLWKLMLTVVTEISCV